MYDKMVAQAKDMTTDQLKDARFINNMIDHWTAEDRMWDSVIFAELMARKNKWTSRTQMGPFFMPWPPEMGASTPKNYSTFFTKNQEEICEQIVNKIIS